LSLFKIKLYFAKALTKCYVVLPAMTDYTNGVIGIKIGRGEYGICPYCGRIGQVKDIEGMIFVTHLEGLLPDKEGEAQTFEDECPKPGVPLKPSHPKQP
jgi:hypothetical protein